MAACFIVCLRRLGCGALDSVRSFGNIRAQLQQCKESSHQQCCRTLLQPTTCARWPSIGVSKVAAPVCTTCASPSCIVGLPAGCCQVFERLKAAAAFVALARAFTKSTKTAEAKLAKAAAKLAKLPGLTSMEPAAAAASPVAAGVAALAPALQQASTAKVRCV